MDTWPSFRHAEGSASSSATSSPSRQGPAKEHMKRGAHLLAPGPAAVEGRFVRELRLFLDLISEGGESTREREVSFL